jgi:hypothetical protein
LNNKSGIRAIPLHHMMIPQRSGETGKIGVLIAYLGRFFDEVIAHLRDADSILIFGPGEAKRKLQKHIEGQALSERIVDIETTDNMTDGQIAAKVRQHFQG